MGNETRHAVGELDDFARHVFGGVASGGRQHGQNALFLDDAVHREGLVGVSLSGDVVVDTVVAQGCRPIGEPMFVTRCERNFLYEVDGRAPAARLAQDCIKSVEVLEYPELGMEAVWKIEVEDFPAFIVVDDKGNDFFAEVMQPVAVTRG